MGTRLALGCTPFAKNKSQKKAIQMVSHQEERMGGKRAGSTTSALG